MKKAEKHLATAVSYIATAAATLCVFTVLQPPPPASDTTSQQLLNCRNQLTGAEYQIQIDAGEKKAIVAKPVEASEQERPSKNTGNLQEEVDIFTFDQAWPKIQEPNFASPKPIKILKKFIEKLNFPLKNFVDIKKRGILESFEFVTAISENHASELHPLTSVRRWFPNKTIHVFDIGLKQQTKAKLKSLCNVEVHDVDFSKYPDHVKDPFKYAFKPIIIHEMLSRYNGVFWLDASAELRTNDLTKAYERVKKTDGAMVFHGCPHSLTAATHPDMYKYFSVHNFALFRTNVNSIGASVQLVYRTKFAYEHIYKWLFLCAMDPDCIAPKDSVIYCNFHGNFTDPTYRDCHRFDQSLITILHNHAYNGTVTFAPGIFKVIRSKSSPEDLRFLNNSTCNNTIKH